MKNKIMLIYWLVTLLTFVGAIVLVFTWTPVAFAMGANQKIQKIFYFHLPVAINTFLACMTVFIASIGYLSTRKTWWDDLAMAAAKVSVVLCTGVLGTGMLWGHYAWNVWWTWSPRLTFSFMLWMLYVVYVLVRASIESPQRRAVVGAVYGIVAFLDVPLVYLSVKLLPEYEPLHPKTTNLTGSISNGAMTLTLWLCFIPITLMAVGLVLERYKLARRQRAQRDAARHEGEEGHGFSAIATGGGV
ncbi:MAG: cytochrome c biogenesis protein [Phycisphaerae bacterium]